MRHASCLGRTFVSWLSALALVGASSSQAPRPAATGAGSISGMVVDEATSQPIRHAAVKLATIRSGVVNAINADEAGRFRFERVVSGSYLLYVSALRYPQVQYGAPKSGAAGRAIVMADGVAVTDLTIRLSRGAVITGRVTSPTGEPLIEAQVSLWQWSVASANGERSLVSAGLRGQATDDRGIYRLYDVPPGEYLVATNGERGIIDGPSPDRHQESLPVTRHADVEAVLRGGAAMPPGPASHARYVRTFHPSTTSEFDAALLSVSAGEERTGVDITLKTITTAAIRGTVAMPAGVTQPTAFVRLLKVGRTPGDGLDIETMSLIENGTFKFEDVAPGDYIVSARVVLGATTMSSTDAPTSSEVWLASTPISLDGRDILNVVLTFRQGLTVSGRVRYESATQPTATGLRVGLKALLASDQISLSAPSTIDAAGRFSVSGVTPGQYLVSVEPGGQEGDWKWWLKSALVNGRDVADVPIDLSTDVVDVAVTISDHPASVSGTVSTVSDETTRPWVIVFATDRALWTPQSRRTAGTRALPDGSYRIGRLPAGEYSIVAVAEAANGAWFDPAFLDRLAAAGPVRIALADGEQKTQSLRVR